MGKEPIHHSTLPHQLRQLGDVRSDPSRFILRQQLGRWHASLKNTPFRRTLALYKLEGAMSILWTIIIGFVAGVIARFFHPGNKYEPKGFILTTVLGIVGAVVATYLGQAVGWYHAGEGAGFIGAIVGAFIILVVWGFIAPRLERT